MPMLHPGGEAHNYELYVRIAGKLQPEFIAQLQETGLCNSDMIGIAHIQLKVLKAMSYEKTYS